MAKKKTTSRRTASSTPQADDVDVQSAEEKLNAAREALRQAEQQYEKTLEQASERMEQIRKTTVGDAIDGTLDFVRKHPGTGIAVSAAIGFFLARLFRRPW